MRNGKPWHMKDAMGCCGGGRVGGATDSLAAWRIELAILCPRLVVSHAFIVHTLILIVLASYSFQHARRFSCPGVTELQTPGS
jgi:hypothetical protein